MCCRHLNPVNDHATGDEICQDCGLVLSERNDFSSPCYTIGETSKSTESRINPRMENRLLDILYNANLNPSLNEPTLRLFSSLKTHPTGKNVALLMVCLFETMKIRNVPFSLRELAIYSGVAYSTLKKTHKKFFHVTEECLLPSQLVNRFGAKLNLKSSECVTIVHHLEELEASNSFTMSPLSVCGAAILYYCRRERKNVTLDTISASCQIRPISIKRALSKYFS